MSRLIQAYFRTENDAEDARILLQPFATENLEIGELGERSEGRRFILPFAAGAAGAGMGTTGDGVGMAVAGVAPFAAINELNDTVEKAGDVDLDDLNYVLSAKVKDEEYDQIVQVIRSNNGYMEVPEAE